MNLRQLLLLSGLLALPTAYAQQSPDLNALDAYIAKAVTDFDQGRAGHTELHLLLRQHQQGLHGLRDRPAGG
jgi:hypothetical protein